MVEADVAIVDATHGYPVPATTEEPLFVPWKGIGWPVETEVTAGGEEPAADPPPELTLPLTATISCHLPLVVPYWY